MIKISHSRVQTYLSCPCKHYMRYTEGLRKKSKSRPLSFGSDFHKMLEMRGDKEQYKAAYEDIKSRYYDLPPQDQAELGSDYLSEIKTIFNDYRKIYKDDPLPDATEESFDIPLGRYNGEPVVFTGIIDEIYQEDECIIIGEHKTFSKKPTALTLAMNTQKCLYAKALEYITGCMPTKVQWDYIRSSSPDYPIMLKSGRFSRAKSNNITPHSWRRACKEYGITDKSVIREGTKLYKGNIPNFFFRLTEAYIPAMVNEIFDGFKYTAQQICRCGDKNKTKFTGQNCSWCDFKDICYAELTGGDVDHVKTRDFKGRGE